MNSKSLTYTGIIILIVGIVLLFLQSTAIDVVIMVLGVAFLIAAAVNLYFVFTSRVSVVINGKKESKGSISFGSLLTAIAAAALGLWMLLKPSGFSSLLVYVFAALMILAGCVHIVSLMSGFGGVKFPFVFYILPILLVLTGIVVLILGPVTMMNAIVLVTGICLIVYSVCNFLEAARESSYRK